MIGNGMALSKEKLWKAMREPLERGCVNCLNFKLGDICKQFDAHKCHGHIASENHGKYLKKWKWNGFK